MYKKIFEAIFRQQQALGFLFELLEEEFASLTGRDASAVATCELSIQRLLSQIAKERISLKALIAQATPEAGRLGEYAKTLPEEQQSEIAAVMAEVDAREQACARQSEKNTQIAYALASQSRSLLEQLYDAAKPQDRLVYADNGRYAQGDSQAKVISGRL